MEKTLNQLVSFSKLNCYRPQRSCGKVMFSQASVILFTRRGVWQTPPWPDTPLPPEMVTAADVTHPTGMHSCLK